MQNIKRTRFDPGPECVFVVISLEIVIHLIFHRCRHRDVTAEILSSVCDPEVDKLDRENAACRKEVVIFLECFKSRTQRLRKSLDFFLVFFGKIEKIKVVRTVSFRFRI